MSDEQINIAIAESIGWTKIIVNEIRIVGAPPKCPPPYDEYGLLVPNYTADLNACHEFEKTLGDLENRYCQYLADINWAGKRVFLQIHATARQRCESYLRTIGKWIE